MQYWLDSTADHMDFLLNDALDIPCVIFSIMKHIYEDTFWAHIHIPLPVGVVYIVYLHLHKKQDPMHSFEIFILQFLKCVQYNLPQYCYQYNRWSI